MLGLGGWGVGGLGVGGWGAERGNTCGMIRLALLSTVLACPTLPAPLLQMFCTVSFASIRAMSCSASAMCRRFSVLNNVLVTNLVLPVWFSLGLLWVKTEPFGRQRQIALFSMAGVRQLRLRHCFVVCTLSRDFSTSPPHTHSHTRAYAAWRVRLGDHVCCMMRFCARNLNHVFRPQPRCSN